MSSTGSNQLSINLISAANGYNFTGTPRHFAVSGNTDGQAFMDQDQLLWDLRIMQIL
jgi:hypothetical protein